MTEAQRDALAEELAELEGPKRAEMVEAIATARSFGDLSENFEYHAAKNEQGLLERRIAILRHRVENAVIVEKAADGVVGVGSVVEVEDEQGGRFEVEISSLGGGISTDSPLGSALFGAGQIAREHARRRHRQQLHVAVRGARVRPDRPLRVREPRPHDRRRLPPAPHQAPPPAPQC